MAVSVAEYAGQRTDVNAPVISPQLGQFQCPFMNSLCSKAPRNKPVCSVRDSPSNTLWIVCENRLCATHGRVPLSAHQQNILLKVAREIYPPNTVPSDVIVRREVGIPVVAGSTYSADYIMMRRSPSGSWIDPVVLEMQGGGETSDTGRLTQHVNAWEQNTKKTNAELRIVVDKVGTLETNAWRRQQEQFLVKGNVSFQTGGRIVFCVGTLLYDYLIERVKNANLRNLRAFNWSLALLAFMEDPAPPKKPGPIPLVMDPKRQLFTNYPTFVQVLTNQGDPNPDMFRGDFVDLSGGPQRVV